MSREKGKRIMEVTVDTDTVIWGCDQCGKKVELPHNTEKGMGFPPPPPSGWITLRVSDGTEAMHVTDEKFDTCGNDCAAEWIFQRSKTPVPV